MNQYNCPESVASLRRDLIVHGHRAVTCADDAVREALSGLVSAPVEWHEEWIEFLNEEHGTPVADMGRQMLENAMMIALMKEVIARLSDENHRMQSMIDHTPRHREYELIDGALSLVYRDGTRREYKVRGTSKFAVTCDSAEAFPWQVVEIDKDGRMKSTVKSFCFRTSQEAVEAIRTKTWGFKCID